MVYNWLKNTHSWLFPMYCELCRAPTHNGHAICPDCDQELPWLAPGCPTCATPRSAGAAPTLCATCRQTPPFLDGCHALFDYRAPVDQWIRNIKFHQQLTLAKMLGRLLAEHVPEGDNATLIPVPLHPRRLRQRGFNQALEIARPLQRRGYRIDARCCVRTRHTPAQSRLPATTRRHNLDKAFRVRHDMSTQRVILIDDVVTTGATLNALARVLKQAGATQVEAWVIARTPEPRSRQDRS